MQIIFSKTRSKIRLCNTFKISDELFNYGLFGDYLNVFIKNTKKSTNGKRLFLLSVSTGYDSDNFVKNLLTVIVIFNVYKKPRFIK